MGTSLDAAQRLATATLDEDWASTIRGLPAAEREALLAAADRCRDGAEGGNAFACYRALADTLRIDDDRDCGRIEWALEQQRGPDPALDDLARRAQATKQSESLATRATLMVGLAALHRGDDAEAVAQFRRVLATSCGTGSRHELSAALNLALMSLIAGREFEALMLSRRAARLAELVGDERARVYALCHRAGSLYELEDWPRFDAALQQVWDALERRPPEEGATLVGSLHSYAALAALRRGHAETAQRECAALVKVAPNENPVWLASFQAELLLLQGRTAEARERLDAVPIERPPRTPYGARACLTDVRILLAEDRRDEAREVATILVDALSDAAGWLGPADRLRFARAAGRILMDDLGALALARRSYDVAGVAALDRIREIERFARDFPNQGETRAENREILAEYRLRFAEQHEEVLRALVRIGDRMRAGGEDPFSSFAMDDGLGRTCAWCASVRTADGTWVPVLAYLSADISTTLTHGICPDCYAKLPSED